MKRKKILISIFFSLFSVIICQAQNHGNKSNGNDEDENNSGFPLSFGANFGIGAPTNIEYIGTVRTTTTESYINSSLGAGVNLDVYAQYKVCHSFSVGLDAGYMAGFPISGSSQNIGYLETYTEGGGMFSLSPFAKLSAHDRDKKCVPYAKFGPVVGFPFVSEVETQSGPGARAGSYTSIYSGGLSLGWQGAIGVEYPLLKKYPNIKLHAEIGERNISYMPDMVTNTTTFTGLTLSPPQKFIDNYNYMDPQPNSRTKVEFPFSSFNFTVGATITLENKTSGKK